MRFYVFRFLITEFIESDCVPWSCKENDEDKKRSKLYRSTPINLMLFRTTDQDLFIALSIFVSSYIALGFTFRFLIYILKLFPLCGLKTKALYPPAIVENVFCLLPKQNKKGKSPHMSKSVLHNVDFFWHVKNQNANCVRTTCMKLRSYKFITESFITYIQTRGAGRLELQVNTI